MLHRVMIAHPTLLLALLVSCASLLGCASPQVRPTSPDPFLGDWTGTWQSSANPASNGELPSVKISRDSSDPKRYRFDATLTRAVVPGFSSDGEFKDGELRFKTARGTTVNFKMLQNSGIEGEYYNPGNRDSGTWNLRRR